MTEYSRNTQTIDHNPDDIANLLPELVAEIDAVETEFVESLTDVLESEIQQEYEQLGMERAEKESLNELPFRPDTIKQVGGVAIMLASPDVMNDVVRHGTVEVVDGEYEKRRKADH